MADRTGPLTLRRTSLVLALAMVLDAALAVRLKPTRYLADSRAPGSIDAAIPATFGDWQQLRQAGGVVNPQQRQALDALYAELVTRSYADAAGQRVMLSIAYGRNQNDSFQVHRPEVCYPAQGFQLLSVQDGQIDTPQGAIPVRRIESRLGAQRPEPVTYWTTLGDHAVRSSVDKKLREVEYAMQGLIADGLVFRVSTIDADSARAFRVQDAFIAQLLAGVDAQARRRLAGLP
ncbi:exosortase-associated protein EpsI, B-type [Leptothrix sp. BB-4]